MNNQSMQFLHIQGLKNWFKANKRDLPWRDNPSPYAVWISEVMLQQTQVAVVIPYFQKWMDLFPTIEDLAKAPLELVIKIWEGLGYYSRARNLHAAAIYLTEHYKGNLPQAEKDLQMIKGLGPYTIGAIRSFAFKQKTAAVDGNVMRVLARYFHVEDDICKALGKQKIWNLATAILPDDEHWVLNEALIEFGATICTKKPKCRECLLKSHCTGYKQGTAEKLPHKSAKIKIEHLKRAVAIIEYKGLLLVRKGEAGKVMSDLQEFPYFSIAEELSQACVQKQIEELIDQPVHFICKQPMQCHSFTRYQVTLWPYHFKTDEIPQALPGYQWKSPEDLDQQAFSAGHRRVYATWKSGC